MKSGKGKLIFSSTCLIAAFALAVFTVYAWFSINDKVTGSGIDSDITSGDVISFEIDYYETTISKTSEEETEYTVGDKIKQETKEGITNKWLPDFDSGFGSDSDATTAVLADVKLKFSKTGNFYLKAKTTHSDVYLLDKDNQLTYKNFTEKNYLSNVINFREIDKEGLVEGSTFEVPNDAYEYSFINSHFDGVDDDEKKTNSVDLYGGALAPYKVTKTYTELHIYYLIDYIPEQVDALYVIMVQQFPDDANLNSQIIFNQDIIFEIGRPDNG